MNIKKNCEACDALISVRLADHKRGWGRFCDKSCAAAYKIGMRPRDVNAEHAKYSPWAAMCMKLREQAGVNSWPKAERIKDQVGKKVKVTPYARKDVSNDDDLDLYDDDMPEGWDDHKVWSS